jgi:hypothetical protein
MKVDTCRLGTELAAPLDDTYYLEVPYPRKIRIWVGKRANGARGHPHLDVPSLSKNSTNSTKAD